MQDRPKPDFAVDDRARPRFAVPKRAAQVSAAPGQLVAGKLRRGIPSLAGLAEVLTGHAAPPNAALCAPRHYSLLRWRR